MKTLLFFFGVLALAWTLQVPFLPQQQTQLPLFKTVGEQSLDKQQIVLNLLEKINQPGSIPEVENVGLNYDIQANIQNYKNPQVVVDFLKLYTTGVLPKGQIFSIFNAEQRREAIAFFRVLYNAVDFDTLYKTAAWGRMFLNEGLYIYALSVALVHRSDTWTIQLPPIYEIYPYFFYNVGVLQQVEKVTGSRVGFVTMEPYPRMPMQTQPAMMQNQQRFIGVPWAPIQSQQGVIQNQGLVQGQQGPIQTQQGSIQNLQQLYQSLPLSLQSQQGFLGTPWAPIQSQQGVIQNQGWIQGHQGPIQTQQWSLQNVLQLLQSLPLSLQTKEGLLRTLWGPTQSQQGAIQNQGWVQGQQGPIQTQQGSVQNLQQLYQTLPLSVQNQLRFWGTPIQSQQGPIQNQGWVQGQQGPIQTQQGSTQNLQQLYQSLPLSLQKQMRFLGTPWGTPIQSQQGPIQNQGWIQGQQGPIQTQQGSVQNLQQLYQSLPRSIQTQQVMPENVMGPAQNQQGFIQNQGWMQGQQGPIQTQQGAVQNTIQSYPSQQGLIPNLPGFMQRPQALIQGQLGPMQGLQQIIESQLGPMPNQQGLIQNQQEPIEGLEGLIQNQQLPMQGQQGLIQTPPGIQSQQGLIQNQQLPMQGQQGLIQNLPGIQSQEGLIQNQQLPMQGQQGLIQNQMGMQSQQGSVLNQRGFLPNQMGSMVWQQTPTLNQQVPVQSKLRFILSQLGLLPGLIRPQLAPNQGMVQIQTPQGQGVFPIQTPQGQSIMWQGNVPYSVEYLQQYGRAPYVTSQVPPQYFLGGFMSHNSMNVQNSPQTLQQALRTGFQVPVFPQRPVLPFPLGSQVSPQQIGQQQIYGLNILKNMPVQQVPTNTLSGNPSMQYLNKWINKLVITNPKLRQMIPEDIYTFQEREKLQMRQNPLTNGITIDADSVSFPPQQNLESFMTYFTEDVGLNAFFYYYNIYFPFWMTNEEIAFSTERRGEQFYFVFQQLLARYNLERISNGLSEVPLINVRKSIQTGFQPNLVNPNGIPFVTRPENALAEKVFPWIGEQIYNNQTMSLKNLDLYDRRLLDAIDSGFVLTREGKLVSMFTPQGLDMLGNIIQTNTESPNVRYYGSVMSAVKTILSTASNPLDQFDTVGPNVLEHFETSLRDPVFYQVLKRIMYYFQRYQQYLPTYTEEQLLMPGVQIQDVTVDKLVTFFDSFYSDISSIVTPQGSSQEVPVQIRQSRLNHRPFNYYLNVQSEQSADAVVRVFLGPKNDILGMPIDINKNRLNFVELDTFQYSLIPGLNTIVRNSRQFIGYMPDRTTTRELFMQLINFQTTPVQTVPSVQWGIPQRLLLPKGTQQGMEYQIYVMITPMQRFMKKQVQLQRPTLYWDVTPDTLSLGFPLDRPIDRSVFFVPNSFFRDVMIFHEQTPIMEPLQIQKEFVPPMQTVGMTVPIRV